jgi:hypothetical protein
MDGAAAENDREMAKHMMANHKILSQTIDLFHTLCARTPDNANIQNLEIKYPLKLRLLVVPIIMLRYLDRREIY